MMRKREFLQKLTIPLLLGSAASWNVQAADTSVDKVLRHYGALVLAGYEDALAGARALQATIATFIAKPGDEALQAARRAWLAARESYGQTEAFRFYGGPIDDEHGPEGRLNAWPMDEAYVDRVDGKPNAGIVNNRKIAISKAALKRLNERGGEENVATGWHAIEFLLWGQDLDANGAGARSYEDYVDGKAPNADRRRQYLGTVTGLLVDDLQSLVVAWRAGAANYRRRFEHGGMESVRKMIVGLGALSRGELAGERMEVALNTQDQEDEHSCFSDNTHRDIVNNALGIENVWLGRFLRRDGSTLQGDSLRDLVAAKDAALAQQVSERVAASVAAARAIVPPFDREIIGGKDAPGRLRVQATIDSLVQQSKDLALAAAALGITRLNQASSG
ncbi:MAG: imelysin family protein [Burkholderiaceae bacterium]|nr:iron-regulated protein [Rhodoferax sp.]MCB2004870.1 iron-regulated protein [Rhodoferax sp.]MCB2028464.1 iron-regulated protein [Rhodoferax sp.]MCB2040305.1 iron-regulated protein [Rhodoferax sp.]MCP5259750.1 iron-regulated protein [Rhodoferax sp.]